MRNKLLTGLTSLAFVLCAAFAFTGDIGLALIAFCVALAFMPPSFDPAIIWKERQTRPSCFQSGPKPQTQAENDCFHCPAEKEGLSTRFISWYIAPATETVQYLAWGGPGEGFHYVRDRKAAYRFNELPAALLATPGYDVSARIKERSGVEIA